MQISIPKDWTIRPVSETNPEGPIFVYKMGNGWFQKIKVFIFVFILEEALRPKKKDTPEQAAIKAAKAIEAERRARKEYEDKIVKFMNEN